MPGHQDPAKIIKNLEFLAEKASEAEVSTSRSLTSLSISSLVSDWEYSFSGTRHCESQFAIEYARDVSIFTPQFSNKPTDIE